MFAAIQQINSSKKTVMENFSRMKLAMESSPGVAISSQVALNMIEGYKLAHPDTTETIYSDFTYSKLIAFMAFFPTADGIRIYNARTATDEDCFLFVPIKNVSVTDVPCWVEMNPVPIGPTPTVTNIAAFNFGTLCPPGGGCNCACDGVNDNPESMAKQVYGNLCP
jgi:hypothetical protein